MESALLVFLLSAMILLSFSQVLLRQLFGTGLLWGDTLARHLVLWVGFLGAGLAAAEGKHFAWEGPSYEPEGRVSSLRWAAPLATIVITSFLTKTSWSFLREEMAAGSVLFHIGSLEISSWIFAIIIPAGFMLLLLHTGIRVLLKS